MTYIGEGIKMGGSTEKWRPWFPGPWELDGTAIGAGLSKTPIKWFAKFHGYVSWEESEIGSLEMNSRRKATAKLCSKSPDMAELLIELCHIATDPICDDVFGRLGDVYDKALKLIQEIGYQAVREGND